jgi:hypothetical protein
VRLGAMTALPRGRVGDPVMILGEVDPNRWTSY